MAVPRARVEPNPALVALLDAPLKLDLSPELQARIQQLRAPVRAITPSTDARPTYAEGIAIGEAIVASLEGRLAEIEARAAELPDANELRAQRVAPRRKAADDLKARIRADVTRLTAEAVERLGRQRQNIAEEQTEAAKQLHLAVELAGATMTTAVPTDAWANYLAYCAECERRWADQARAGLEVQLAAAAEARLGAWGADRAPWEAPAAAAWTTPTPAPPSAPRSQDGPIPSVLASLGQFVRSNLMLVSMGAMIAGAPLALLMDNASGMSGTVRAALITAAVPVIVTGGVLAGRNRRRDALAKATATTAERVTAAVLEAAHGRLEALHERLARALKQRGAQVEAALQAWWRDAVDPALAELEAGVAEEAQRNRLDLRRLAEEQARLRKAKEDLSDRLLFELRKHAHALQEEADRPEPS